MYFKIMLFCWVSPFDKQNDFQLRLMSIFMSISNVTASCLSEWQMTLVSEDVNIGLGSYLN